MRPAVGCLTALVLLSAGTLPAGAQQAQPPQRNADTWNGLNHEPVAGKVQAKERNAGIAPDAQRQRGPTDEVEHLDRKLEHRVPGE